MAVAVEEEEDDEEDDGDGGGEAHTMDGRPPVVLERLRGGGVSRESLRRVRMQGFAGVRRKMMCRAEKRRARERECRARKKKSR
jgi:hypothetical protein